jgi:predicted transposase YdaD
MAKTDNPLKRLVVLAASDVAAWLLNSPVRSVTTRPSNLVPPAQALDSDLVFFVTLEDGREVILHLELQGPGSKRPMPIRMLEYQIRLAATYPNMPFTSVVWYVGKAGEGDTGAHQRTNIAGQTCLTWQYQVIHLWELDGEALLALNRPTLAALIGQTRLRDPAPALRQAVRQIVTGTRGELQELLLLEFLTLCTDKEVAAMAEQIVQYDSYGMEESPFIRKWKDEGRVEGRVKGQLALLLRQLTRRYGPLPVELTAQAQALTATQMLDLADALLDFTSRDALAQWLEVQN